MQVFNRYTDDEIPAHLREVIRIGAAFDPIDPYLRFLSECLGDELVSVLFYHEGKVLTDSLRVASLIINTFLLSPIKGDDLQMTLICNMVSRLAHERADYHKRPSKARVVSEATRLITQLPLSDELKDRVKATVMTERALYCPWWVRVMF